VGDGSAQVPTARRPPPSHDDGGSFPVKALLADAPMPLRVVWLPEGWLVSDALKTLAMGMTLHAGEEVLKGWNQPHGGRMVGYGTSVVGQVSDGEAAGAGSLASAWASRLG
jgi:hypothetical protein